MSAADINAKAQRREGETAFAEAREHQWLWKTPAMAAMAVAVCRVAIERAGQEFSANDLPEFKHGGTGIAGAVFYRLLHDEIIAQVGHFGGDMTFYPKIVKNAGGNKVNVYRLKSYARALRLIEVHAAQKDERFRQAELPVT